MVGVKFFESWRIDHCGDEQVWNGANSEIVVASFLATCESGTKCVVSSLSFVISGGEGAAAAARFDV